MIHCVTDDGLCLILGQHEIDRLKGGHAIVLPDRSIKFYYSPDLVFTQRMIQDLLEIGKLKPEDFQTVIEESRKQKVRT